MSCAEAHGKRVDMNTTLKKIHALLEKERRINLHRHPIRLSFSNDNLVMEGEGS